MIVIGRPMLLTRPCLSPSQALSKGRVMLELLTKLDDAYYSPIRPHQALRLRLLRLGPHGRKWKERPPLWQRA